MTDFVGRLIDAALGRPPPGRWARPRLPSIYEPPAPSPLRPPAPSPVPSPEWSPPSDVEADVAPTPAAVTSLGPLVRFSPPPASRADPVVARPAVDEQVEVATSSAPRPLRRPSALPVAPRFDPLVEEAAVTSEQAVDVPAPAVTAPRPWAPALAAPLPAPPPGEDHENHEARRPPAADRVRSLRLPTVPLAQPVPAKLEDGSAPLPPVPARSLPAGAGPVRRLLVPAAVRRAADTPVDSFRSLRPTTPAQTPGPVIKVTIGRIDVRAVTPPRPPANRQSPRPEPALSLEDYLRARNGRSP